LSFCVGDCGLVSLCQWLFVRQRQQERRQLVLPFVRRLAKRLERLLEERIVFVGMQSPG
jgi:hypothetical protein